MSATLPIRVVQRAEKQQNRAAAAWLIRSPEPEEWLKEMLHWNLPSSPKLQSVRLFPVPLSPTDLKVSSALVLVPPDFIPRERPLAVPYAHLGHRIYIPADSDVFPALRDEELEQFNKFELLLIHPSLGPIGFDAGDSRSIVELFHPLSQREVDWETAVPGLSAKTRIASISLILPPNIFLPKEPDPSDGSKNPSSSSGAGSGSGDRSGAEAKNWLSSKVSSWLHSFSATHPPQLNRRDQSIQKLIEQLQSDPDEALKKAISLGNSHASRGIGPSSAELSSRNVNFDLRELGGGEAADFWDLKPHQITQLRQHYIRLATRERSLGRHRRAAYIYANLLGDLNNAALMLKEGHFYQEAARLFKDLLHDPTRAADCYIRAGLHQEAVAIYQDLKAWQVLADLHLQMDQPDLARSALYSWVAQLKNVGDVLQAADVLFDRLCVTDEALHLLESAWPHHRQAWLCITRALQWRATRGEIDSAIALLKRIGARVYPEPILPSFLSVLIEVKKMFGAENVRALAEDLGRIHVAKYLSQNNSTHEQQNIISSLISLGREDHLLRRDAMRFLDQLRSTRSKQETQKLTGPLPFLKPKESAQQGAPIDLLSQFLLKTDVSTTNEIWFRACPFLNYFVALGYKDSPAPQPHQLRLTRSTFDGQVETFPIPVPTSNRILLTNHSGNLSDLLFIHPLPKPPENPILKQTDAFPRITEIVGNFIGDSASLLASTFSTAGDLWTLQMAAAGMTLTAYQSNGTLLCNLALDAMLPVELLQEVMESSPFPQASVCVLDKLIALSFADRLFTWETKRVLLDSHFDHYDISSPVHSIMAGSGPAKIHLALVCENAVYMLWPEEPLVGVQTIRENLQNPIACFTRDGILVVIDEQGGNLYECDSKGTGAHSSFKWVGPPPIALIPGTEKRQFVTISKTGMVQTYQYNSTFRKKN